MYLCVTAEQRYELTKMLFFWGWGSVDWSHLSGQSHLGKMQFLKVDFLPFTIQMEGVLTVHVRGEERPSLCSRFSCGLCGHSGLVEWVLVSQKSLPLPAGANETQMFSTMQLWTIP